MKFFKTKEEVLNLLRITRIRLLIETGSTKELLIKRKEELEYILGTDFMEVPF